MPSRRFHNKSRTGCIQCRGRKTKCDESKPSCDKCRTRGLTCSFVESSLVIIPSRTVTNFPPQHSPKISVTNASTTAQGTQEGTSGNPQIHLDIDFSLSCALRDDEQDILRLIHHYSLCTCKIISHSPEIFPVWQDFVPRLAFEHDFLLHGLLAVTALHLNILYPSTEHSNAALQHYANAIALFRPHLSEITLDNISALFAFSCLLPLYSFGIKITSLSAPDSLSEILEIFTLLRGISIIVRNGSHWLKNGPFGVLLPLDISDCTRGLPQDIEDTLAILSIRSRETTLPPNRGAFDAAVAMLRGTFLLAPELSNNTMTILPFPIRVPEEFVDGLREQQPIALAILAHYAVVLYWLRGNMWLRGWGSRIVDAVAGLLGEEWVDCMAWPVTQLGRDMKAP